MYLGRIKLKPRYRCSNVEKLEKLINFILFFQRSDPPTSACYLISTLRHVPCDASTYKMRGSRASAKHRQVKKKKKIGTPSPIVHFFSNKVVNLSANVTLNLSSAHKFYELTVEEGIT